MVVPDMYLDYMARHGDSEGGAIGRVPDQSFSSVPTIVDVSDKKSLSPIQIFLDCRAGDSHTTKLCRENLGACPADKNVVLPNVVT